MHHSFNTNIRCSSKMCFLIALNDPNDLFDPTKVKKGDLWIGAVDNSIVPFKSSKSFTDDVAMFFSVCNHPYDTTYYRIQYPDGVTPNFNALKYQFDAVEQSPSLFNYMYHTTLFNDTTSISKQSVGTFFDDDWVKNSFNDLKIVANVFGTEIEINLGVPSEKGDDYNPDDYIFPLEYFKKTKTDLVYHDVFDINKTNMFEFYGVNNNGQVCHVTVPAPDEFINPLYFQKYIIDMFKKNKLIDYRIMNIGLLFNSIIEEDDEEKSRYPYTTLVNNFSILKNEKKLEDKIFNFDPFKTKVEVEEKDTDEFKKRNTGFVETSMKTVDIIPGNAYRNGILDEDLASKIKYSIYTDYIDYCELSNNKKSLYIAPERPNKASDYNKDLPPGLDPAMLSKRCFIISSYKEEEKKKYIENCSRAKVETYTVFYEIEDENGLESIENVKTYSYTVNLDQSTLDQFPALGTIGSYSSIAPIFAEYYLTKDLAKFAKDNEDSDDKWVSIKCLGSFADVPSLAGKLFGMYHIDAAGKEGDILVMTMKLDLDLMCNLLYDPKVVNLRKLHMYSENWLNSDIMAFMEAFTDFRITSHNVATIATEYNLECCVEGVFDQEAFKLFELDQNRLILPIYKKTPPYEERKNKLLKLEYMFYDINDQVNLLFNYNTKVNNITPIEFKPNSECFEILDEFKKAYIIPYNQFVREPSPKSDYFSGMLTEEDKVTPRKVDGEYIKAMYKTYEDIHNPKEPDPNDPDQDYTPYYRFIYSRIQE